MSRLPRAVGVALVIGASAFAPLAYSQSSDGFEAIYAREAKLGGAETVKAYTGAAESGSCQAAKRLGEIYDRGMMGIARDYAQALKWSTAARVLGCDIPVASSETAAALDAQGKGPEALDAYDRAARAGNCYAAQRLGEIYDQGLIGVQRNYAESLKWYNAARVLGCDIAFPARK